MEPAYATPVSTPYAPRPTTTRPDLTSGPLVRITVSDDGQVAADRNALLYASYPFFFSELHDDQGHNLIVERHHEEWTSLLQNEPLLVLMAPRDHGKTFCGVCYLLWLAWRHNRSPETGQLDPARPDGTYQAVIFSETLAQAGIFFDLLQSFLLGNPVMFADLLPDRRQIVGQARGVWSRRRVRLRNGFECSIRAFRTSTRGLHPDLILLDDVLSEKNTQTAYQRGKVWNYFVGTLMPMNPKQIIVVGTAQHYDDLLHRLKPDPKKALFTIGNRLVRFKWVKYRSVNWDTGQVLWERKHNLADLAARRDLDPLIFAREYQNDPRDDASSLFPFPLTKLALDQGAELTFVPTYRKDVGDHVLLGMDLAASEAVGADYTVIWVAAYNRPTGKRRILWALRAKGLTFDQQLNHLARAFSNYGVDLGVVEENGFQKWLRVEAQKYPEIGNRLIGHRTGREKASLTEGVPSMKLGLLQQAWIMPSGDQECREIGHVWQSEMSAFGWKDDKLQGVGEHDDTVMAFWFLDRAVRQLEEWLALPREEVIMGEDVGIDRVSISADY